MALYELKNQSNRRKRFHPVLCVWLFFWGGGAGQPRHAGFVEQQNRRLRRPAAPEQADGSMGKEGVRTCERRGVQVVMTGFFCGREIAVPGGFVTVACESFEQDGRKMAPIRRAHTALG